MGTKPTKLVSSGQALDSTIVTAQAMTGAIKKSGINSDQFQRGVLERPDITFDFFDRMCQEVVNSNLDQIRCLKTIEAKASDGRRLIYRSRKEVEDLLDIAFKYAIESSLRSKCEYFGPNSDEGLVVKSNKIAIYELFRLKTLEASILSLEKPLEELVMTKSQIIDVCFYHQAYLCQSRHDSVFFIKQDPTKLATPENLFAMYTYFDSISSNLLQVNAHRFSAISHWSGGECLYNFFAPAPQKI